MLAAPAPRPTSQRTRRPAFTLLEMLGVIALFGLIASLVLMNHDALLPAFRHASPESALRSAFASARRHAMRTKSKSYLRFDPASATLCVRSGDGATLDTLPCCAPGKTDLRFDHHLDADNARDLPEITEVAFSPAGHHAPVRVQLRDGARVRRFRSDAFSGVLVKEESR